MDTHTTAAAAGADGSNTGNANGNGNTTNNSVTPRDVRLLRLIFAAQGVAAYEDHVPLQLMDFAYRYTHGVLQDATVYNDYAHPTYSNAGNSGNSGNGNDDHPGGTNSKANAAGDDDDLNSQMLSNEDIRLAIAARTSYQFRPIPPKKMLLELAAERNEKPLPAVMPMWGLRLPPEKYCLTAKDWEDPPAKKKKTGASASATATSRATTTTTPSASSATPQ